MSVGAGDSAGHRVVAGSPDSPVVLHVPHASTVIPPDVRAGLLLDDEELAAELARMTDTDTDLIAERAAAAAARRPWSFVNLLSRLVVDPERFPDAREEMRAAGMSAVYTRTSDGRPLRAGAAAAEEELLSRWYRPYARGMSDLVDARLAATGRAIVVDVHSYPSRRLPYERGGPRRPAVCLGTHPVHTSGWLLAAAREAFAGCGDIAENTPFAGCYVPLRHYGRNPRVGALMVELRRDRYLAEPSGPATAGLPGVIRALTRLIDRVSGR